MLQGKQWPVFLRFWTETFEGLLRKHAEFEGSPRGDALLEAVGPVIPGTGIIMSVSFLERVILDKLIANESGIKIVKLTNDDWVKELELDKDWSGWPLVEILTRLRHCFAHEYGRATKYQIKKLKDLLNLITNNPIKVHWSGKEYLIGPFYKINDETLEITLESKSGKLSPSQSVRIIILSFLNELEKAGIVDMEEWKNAGR